MATEKTNNHVDGCKCWGCYGTDGRFSILRIILGVIALGIVFGVGLHVGECRGGWRYGYGYDGENDGRWRSPIDMPYNMMPGYNTYPQQYNHPVIIPQKNSATNTSTTTR